MPLEKAIGKNLTTGVRISWVRISIAAGVLIAGCLWLGIDRGRLTGPEMDAVAAMAGTVAQTGEPEAAVALYEGIMQRSGAHPYVRLQLAAALFRKGNLDAAEAHYRILYESGGASPVVIYNLASVLRRQGRHDEAGTLLREFLAEYGQTFPGLARRAQATLAQRSE